MLVDVEQLEVEKLFPSYRWASKPENKRENGRFSGKGFVAKLCTSKGVTEALTRDTSRPAAAKSYDQSSRSSSFELLLSDLRLCLGDCLGFAGHWESPVSGELENNPERNETLSEADQIIG